MVKGSIEWEHDPDEGLVLKIKPALGKMFSDEARKHAIASRKEMLLALRSVIDIAVKRLEEKEKRAETKSTKIEVE